MLRDRKIAVFIDVDNCPLQFINYETALNEIAQMGEIVCAKVYGINERKHKEILAHATNLGFDTLLGMRVKKRGAKIFDNRITADVLEAVFTMPSIDAVAIIAAPSDMVYLYRMLHKYDVAVIAYDNGDEFSSNLIDEKLDIGIVELLPAPKKSAPKPKKTIANEANKLLDQVSQIKEESMANTAATEQPSQEVDTIPVDKVEQEEANDSDLVKKLQTTLDNEDKVDTAAFMDKLNKILAEE